MKALFKKGDVVGVGNVRYQKLNDDAWGTWVCLTSSFVEEFFNEQGEKDTRLLPESDKPLYKKDGTLNRFGFKWTDEQVAGYYKTLTNQ